MKPEDLIDGLNLDDFREDQELTGREAALIAGLSFSGYNKQAGGERPVSRQTHALHVAWLLMSPKTRERYIDILTRSQEANDKAKGPYAEHRDESCSGMGAAIS